MSDHCCCCINLHHAQTPALCEVTEADIERWLHDVPGAVARLLPDCDKRKDVIGAIHEAARLAREIIGQASA